MQNNFGFTISTHWFDAPLSLPPSATKVAIPRVTLGLQNSVRCGYDTMC